jgi:hypothetical protein
MNAAILGASNASINRFSALDSPVCEAGALPTQTKALLGL